MAVKEDDETLKAEKRASNPLPPTDSVADPALASALDDASGAIVGPAISDAVDVSHESVYANPREGTTAAQNAIDWNEPKRLAETQSAILLQTSMHWSEVA